MRGVTTSPNTSRCIVSHGAVGPYAPSTECSGHPTLPPAPRFVFRCNNLLPPSEGCDNVTSPLLNLRRCDPEPPWLPFRGGPRVPKVPGAGSRVAQVAQAGLHPCAFVPSCQLEGLLGGGSLPFSHWAPYLGQSQHFCWERSFSHVEIVPRRSHAGKKEVGQKCRAELWHEDCHMQEAFEVQEDGHPCSRP